MKGWFTVMSDGHVMAQCVQFIKRKPQESVGGHPLLSSVSVDMIRDYST